MAAFVSLPFAIIFVILLLSSGASSSFLCTEKDAAALLKIKHSFSDCPAVASWNESTDCCTWDSVSCNSDGAVDSIDIYNSKYAGPLPAPFGDLHALVWLIITDVPRLSGPIPPFFQNFRHLKAINIRFTALSGHIPPFLCTLPELYSIDLRSNRLSGPLPGCFDSKFNTLQLGQNKLSGAIPPSLFRGKSAFTQGNYLDLSDNLLTGRIPRSFNTVKLYLINLSGNRLTGDAYPLFGVPKAALFIDVSRNELAFDLSPVKFPRKLQSLNISHNRIYGRIPQQINKVTGVLSTFDVSYNELCGQIPSGGTIGQMPVSAFDHNKCLCGAPLPLCNGTAQN